MTRIFGLLRRLLAYPARLGRPLGLHKDVIILLPENDPALLRDITDRLVFYTFGKQVRLTVTQRPPLLRMLLGVPTLCFHKGPGGQICRLFPHTYAVDHRTELAAWEWIRFAHDITEHIVDLRQSRCNLETALAKCREYDRSYVFGTGPSLARAGERSWSDGFRIVCNTIVRDRELVAHIAPHFIVAGDAVYHFSHTQFARQFRVDLRARLAEQSGIYFVYPEAFDVVVRAELGAFADRLVPIPTGGPRLLDINLLDTFRLPSLGNVLALLLLPLALTVTRRVLMIGFDGRDPRDDKSPFWANSARHAYPELMWTLKEQFPAFFQIIVPNNDSRKYVKSVHEDLEGLLCEAESRGNVVEMLHPSWTETLQRRYPGTMSRENYYYGETTNG